MRARFPQPADCGSQADKPYELQPDKASIAGYALALLYEESKERKYLDAALHTARVLAGNMTEGDEQRSPWPFRAPRARLWAWIRDRQIPNSEKDASLWVQFFEDYDKPDNRNAWAPLNLARYLCEKQAALDAGWREHARALIEFVNRRFITVRFGVPVCGEQDDDKNPWGGILANYGGALAVYTGATGSAEYKLGACLALTLGLYAVDEDGCPWQSVTARGRGGWQEDAHTDRIHNLIDALKAVPEWARR